MTPTTPAATADIDPVRSRTGLTRLGSGLFLGALAWAVPLLCFGMVLLPAKLADLAPDDKVSLVALFTIASSIVSLVTNIVFGTLSDMTRSRFGRRNPWVVSGALAASVIIVFMSVTQSIAWLLVGYCCLAAAMNAVIAVLVAMIPDRVPTERRGSVSAASGVGVLIGGTIGALVGAMFVDDPDLGMAVLAPWPCLMALACVALTADFSNRHVPRVPFSRAQLLAAVSFPRRAPDFYWAFAGRFLIILGYYVVSAYQLYILTDYIGLSDAESAAVITSAAVINLITAVIGSAVFGPLSDRLGRRKVPVIVASGLIGLGVLVPALSPSSWTILVFAGIAGLGLGAFFAVDAALITEVLPTQHSRAKDLGILNMATTGGQMIAPGVGSLVVGAGLGFAPVFLIAFAICMLGGLAILPIKSVR
ncbi:MFS transporter [Actinomadura sp. 9N407]|uniref:MFS transporter n=1 Tax=Actinomadura sp. 9N407 TaxID=3375154 RepID=UPI00379BDAC3